MQVLAIAGSLRAASHNRALLRAAAAKLPPGVELRVYEGLAEIPAFDEDSESVSVPVAVERLRAAIADADAVLFATPEYNSSIPGFLKNALDWVSRPVATNTLRNKPVAVVGASTGMFGAVWAQAELRKVLAFIGARVIDRELPVAGADEAFGDDGALLDPAADEELGGIVGALLDEAGAWPKVPA